MINGGRHLTIAIWYPDGTGLCEQWGEREAWAHNVIPATLLAARLLRPTGGPRDVTVYTAKEQEVYWWLRRNIP